MKKIVLIISTTLLIVSCKSTIDNKLDFQSNPKYQRPLVKAQIMPTTEQLQGKPIRVIVVPTETNNKLAKKSQSVDALNNSLDNILQQAGLEIIDRSMGDKVKDELIAYETTGKYSESSIDVADIAIWTNIASASFSHNFTEGHEGKNIFTGKKIWIEPSCTFKAKVKGTAKSFKLPNLELNNQVSLDGVATISRDTRGSSCHLPTVEIYGLINEAATTAVRNYRTTIQNAFAPRAYVLEYRVVNNKHYIQISLGSNRQLNHGDDIKFIRQVNKKHAITQESSINEFPIGEGEVTDIIQQKTSWVEVNPQVAQQLQIGDIAMITYSKSIFEHVNSVSQTLNNL
jgi:hypothetical protein